MKKINIKRDLAYLKKFVSVLFAFCFLNKKFSMSRLQQLT